MEKELKQDKTVLLTPQDDEEVLSVLSREETIHSHLIVFGALCRIEHNWSLSAFTGCCVSISSSLLFLSDLNFSPPDRGQTVGFGSLTVPMCSVGSRSSFNRDHHLNTVAESRTDENSLRKCHDCL